MRAAADAIRSGENTVLMLGGAALRRALEAAGRIARATGVRLISETPIAASSAAVPARRWTGCPIRSIWPWPSSRTRDAWCWPARARGGLLRLSGQPSLLRRPIARGSLATQEQDLAQALEWLADELGIAADAPRLAAPVPTYEVPASGKLTGAAVNILVAHTLRAGHRAMNPSPRT